MTEIELVNYLKKNLKIGIQAEEDWDRDGVFQDQSTITVSLSLGGEIFSSESITLKTESSY